MAFSPETYALCLKNTTERIEEALTSVYNYKGSVDTIADLPLIGNKVGDTYDVKSEGGQNYGWNGESWDSLGVNREATETDLGLIKKKDNTFNTTTFVGDITAINSDKTSITGSGITSINGEGNFEVSKTTTVLASKTNNIAGEVVNATPSNSINISTKDINLTSVDGNGITITATGKPIVLTGNVIINGSNTTYINTKVETNNLVDAQNLKVRNNVDILNNANINNTLSVEKNIYALNIGLNNSYNSFLKDNGTNGVMILGKDNTLNNPLEKSSVTKSVIIGDSNVIHNTVSNSLTIGNSNYMLGSFAYSFGKGNFNRNDYTFIEGHNNNAYALGQIAIGANHNSTNATTAMRKAEYSFISGVSNFANGKAASVLGDNLLGSEETGSLTIGTFNEKKNAMFVVGGGNQSSSSVITRKNVLEVYNDGRFFIGDKDNNYINVSSSNTVNMHLGNSSRAYYGDIDIAVKNIKLHPNSSAGGIFYIGDQDGYYPNISSSSSRVLNINAGNINSVLNMKSGSNMNIESTSANVTLHANTSVELNANFIKLNASSMVQISPASNRTAVITTTTDAIRFTTSSLEPIQIYTGGYGNGFVTPTTYKPAIVNGGLNGVNIGFENKINATSGLKFTLGYGLETSDRAGTTSKSTPYNMEILLGSYNQVSTTGDLMLVGNGQSSSSRSNALRLTGDGYLYYNTGVNDGADYAEFYEWSDGNPNDEDRIGCFVTFDFNKEYDYKSSRQLPHIKIAQPGDYILGVISGNPALIGNGDEEWRERWLYDEFDRPIVDFIEVPIMELQEVETGEYRTEIQYDEDDNEIEVQIPITETKEVDTGKTEWKYVQVLNPDYDENKTYKSRIDRPEWEPIGMLGNLSIKDDGTCIPGEFCKCGVDGIATHADKRDFDTYLVTRRINDNVVKIVFK